MTQDMVPGEGASSSSFELRPIKSPVEVEPASLLCMEAFNSFNATVGLPPEFPTLSSAMGMVAVRAASKTCASFVAAASSDGRVVGFNAISLGDTVGSVGPIAVAEDWWDKKLGRELMKAVIKAGQDSGKTCIVLQQVSSNTKSFCLYLGLGFRPIENCLYVRGLVDPSLPFPDTYDLRRLTPGDVDACDAFFTRALASAGQFTRRSELQASIEAEQPDPAAGQYLLLRKVDGRVAAYISSVTLGGHVVAEDEAAFKALLIGVSDRLRPHGVTMALHLLGRVYPEVAHWAISQARLRLVRQTTVMAWGEGPVPSPEAGQTIVYCPSVDY